MNYFLILLTLVWRWLLAKGRKEQFRRELEFGAKWTGVSLDQALFTGDTEEGRTSKLLAESTEKSEENDVQIQTKEVGLLDIIKSKTLLPRLLVKIYCLLERSLLVHFNIRRIMSTGQQSTFATTASP